MKLRALPTAGLLLAAALAAPAPAAARDLTLNETIEMALAKNEGLVIERESLASAKAAVTRANGAYDPLLAVKGGWNRSTEPLTVLGYSSGVLAPEIETHDAGVSLSQLLPTGGALSLHALGSRETVGDSLSFLSPVYQTQVGAELRQPLFRDRVTDAARLSVRVARAGRTGAVASLRRVVTETVAAVERAYWNLTDTQLEVGVREQAVRLAEQQLGETQNRVDTGDVPKTELAQPRAELERRRGDLLASNEAHARAENALKLLILDGADDPLWSEHLNPVETVEQETAPVAVEPALERALADRPELEMARSVIEQRRAERAYYQNGIWPRLDAVLSYDRYGLSGSAARGGVLPPEIDGGWGRSWDSLDRGGYHAAHVGLELQLPVLNREARGNAAIARHAERQAEADAERVRKTIRAEVLDAVAMVETARQRIEAARSGREAAEVQLGAERDRYEAGLSTNFLILTRQNDLSRARLDEISALTDYRTARTELARATGQLIEENGIHIDGTTH
jgi:outer membrane protein TolC